jgi:hypothetical protein
MLNDNKQELSLSIVKTIAFFDIFYYPLTIYEIFNYLPYKAKYKEVADVLPHLVKIGIIQEKDCFYYLNQRDNCHASRLKRYHLANRKLKIAKKVAKWFSYLPFVKLVALSNLIGRHNMRDESDIDIFVITGKNRLWLSRFFCAGLMKVLNMRPTEKNKKDKICLSFYVDSDHLDLSDLSLENGDDWYFYYWLAGLYPLYDEGSFYLRLMQNNQWLKNYLPNIDFFISNQSYSPALKFRSKTPFIFKGIHKILNLMEKKLQKFQLKIMPRALKEKINVNSQVVIKDGILKLYLNDRRQEFKEVFDHKLYEILKKWPE